MLPLLVWDQQLLGYMPFVQVRNLPTKLSEKRMHFVREKRDKPPGRRFHSGKRLSEKRDKREKTYPPGYSFFVSASAVC